MILVFLVLKAITNNRTISLLVAAVFAVHPYQVDTVAMLDQRENLLNTMFRFAVAAKLRCVADKKECRRVRRFNRAVCVGAPMRRTLGHSSYAVAPGRLLQDRPRVAHASVRQDSVLLYGSHLFGGNGQTHGSGRDGDALFISEASAARSS